MKRKTILVAETNNILAERIGKTLESFEDEIIILKQRPEDSKELERCIITYKPDIVLTNEKKKDFPATDVINKIQSDLEIYQPIFIILSAFDDMDIVCRKKEIMTYYIKKPFQDQDIVECIKAILNNTILENKEVHFIRGVNFSSKNVEYIAHLIEDNEKIYMENPTYKKLGEEMSKINSKIEKKLPTTQKLFKEFASALYSSYDYEMLFLYQYLLYNLKK